MKRHVLIISNSCLVFTSTYTYSEKYAKLYIYDIHRGVSMNAVDNLIKIAEKEIGIKEKPANSNKVKYNTWYYGKEVSGSDYPWCMAFAQWCCNEAGVELPLRTASCSALKTAAKSKNMWVTSNYKPGDLILFDFSGKRLVTSHVGICKSVNGSNITTIDGNTGSTNEANGGAVMERTRNIKYVTGAVRPCFVEKELRKVSVSGYLPSIKKGDSNNYVKILQLLLNEVQKCNLEIDGDFGPATEAAVKKINSTGVASALVWKELMKK